MGIPLAVGLAVGEARIAVLVAVGALIAGVVSMTAPVGVPFGRMVGAGLTMAVSTFVGSVTGAHHLISLGVAAVWGLFAGALVAGGPGTTAIGVQSVTGLVVTGRFPLPAEKAAMLGVWVLVGAGVQLVLAVVLRSPVADSRERGALAQLSDAVARWARSPDDPEQARLTVEPLQLASRVIAEAGQRQAARATVLRSLLDELTRCRHEVDLLVTVAGRLERDDPAEAEEVRASLRNVAAVLDRASVALRRGRPLTLEGPDLWTSSLTDPAACQHVAALGGQLRAVHASLDDWSGTRRPWARPHVAPARAQRIRLQIEMLRAALDPHGPGVRHALRLAVVLPLCEEVARAAGLPRGYWVALTAAQVLRPDFAQTASRGTARVIGTLLGVVPTTLVAAAFHPRGGFLVVLVFISAAATFAAFPAGYALFSVGITSTAVFLLDVVDPRPYTAAFDRTLDTVLGGAISLLAYLLWPAWEGQRLPVASAELVRSVASYADVVLAPWSGESFSDNDFEAAVTRLRTTRGSARASLTRAAAEPMGHQVAAGTLVAEGVLSAANRIVRSLVVLRSLREEPEEVETTLTRLRSELMEALR
jgi:uncharacterized membrane protein YccC